MYLINVVQFPEDNAEKLGPRYSSLQVQVYANKVGMDSAMNTYSYSGPSDFAELKHNSALKQSSHASGTTQDNLQAQCASMGHYSAVDDEAAAAADGSTAVVAATAESVSAANAAVLAAEGSESDIASAQSAFAVAAAGLAKFAVHIEGDRSLA